MRCGQADVYVLTKVHYLNGFLFIIVFSHTHAHKHMHTRCQFFLERRRENDEKIKPTAEVQSLFFFLSFQTMAKVGHFFAGTDFFPVFAIFIYRRWHHLVLFLFKQLHKYRFRIFRNPHFWRQKSRGNISISYHVINVKLPTYLGRRFRFFAFLLFFIARDSSVII